MKYCRSVRILEYVGGGDDLPEFHQEIKSNLMEYFCVNLILTIFVQYSGNGGTKEGNNP